MRVAHLVDIIPKKGNNPSSSPFSTTDKGPLLFWVGGAWVIEKTLGEAGMEEGARGVFLPLSFSLPTYFTEI